MTKENILSGSDNGIGVSLQMAQFVSDAHVASFAEFEPPWLDRYLNMCLLNFNPVATLELARKRKPSGKKQENRGGKLPNQVRHDENASISVGTWKNRGRSKAQIKPNA